MISKYIRFINKSLGAFKPISFPFGKLQAPKINIKSYAHNSYTVNGRFDIHESRNSSLS